VLYKNHNIKNLKNPEFCPHCQAAADSTISPEKRAKSEEHQVGYLKKTVNLIIDFIRWHLQTQAYLQNKEQIAAGKANESLIAMEFSQFWLEKGFCQNLVVVTHLYDPAAVDNLKQIYIHYIGEEGISNDVNFVAGKFPTSRIVIFI